MDKIKGTFYWVTGLSGAGKTTIGKLLYQYLKKRKNNVIFFDGDEIRKVYQTVDYSYEGRKQAMLMHERLCKELTDQGFDVVGCHIGMYKECQDWAKENIPNYIGIYLKVSLDELIRMDSKGLYSKALNKEITNVYGIDLPFDEPQNASVVIENDRKKSPEEVCKEIIEKIESLKNN